jgi:probable F420-dependent oxidoreductase
VTNPGRVGIWTAALDGLPASLARERVAELEGMGFGAVWIPEAVGRDPLVASTLLLDATTRIVVATGIAQIWARDAMAANAAWQTLGEAHPGRFLLGLGVSHRPMIDDLRGHRYEHPLAAMRAYLDAMDAALFLGPSPSSPPTRVLAALGPKMLDLARERAGGAHTYFVPVEHAEIARAALGDDRMLCVEQAVVLETDAARAREIARGHIQLYLGLPNYVNNLRRLGWSDDDLASPGSDRLVDAIVAWGDESAISERVASQHAAGASHVCVQVLTEPQFRDCIDEWRRLGPALLA